MGNENLGIVIVLLVIGVVVIASIAALLMKRARANDAEEVITDEAPADSIIVKRSARRAAEGITPEKVVIKRFSPTKFRGGYSPDEVDEFLDTVVQELRRLEQEGTNLRNGKVSSTSTPFLTPEDAVNIRFGPTKFREGYDQYEVDEFIDLIVAELRRLTTENAVLRSNPPEVAAA